MRTRWAMVALTGLLSASAPSGLNTAQVVADMVAGNAARHSALHAYTAVRLYHVVYQGLGGATADMRVQVEYQEPGPKRFTVESESGSGMLRRHVLDPLLQVEREEAEIEAEQGPALTPANYDFRLLGTPATDPSGDYVLRVIPHKGKRFLFRGTIWIHPGDFGVEKVEGEPTDDHSWWISGTRFSYRSQPLGGFWLPASNHAVCHVRFFGHAVLDIAYEQFHLTSFSQPTPNALPWAEGKAAAGRGN